MYIPERNQSVCSSSSPRIAVNTRTSHRIYRIAGLFRGRTLIHEFRELFCVRQYYSRILTELRSRTYKQNYNSAKYLFMKITTHKHTYTHTGWSHEYLAVLTSHSWKYSTMNKSAILYGTLQPEGKAQKPSITNHVYFPLKQRALGWIIVSILGQSLILLQYNWLLCWHVPIVTHCYATATTDF